MNNLIDFTYKDDGIGLTKKYLDNPDKILEVHVLPTAISAVNKPSVNCATTKSRLTRLAHC